MERSEIQLFNTLKCKFMYERVKEPEKTEASFPLAQGKRKSSEMQSQLKL